MKDKKESRPKVKPRVLFTVIILVSFVVMSTVTSFVYWREIVNEKQSISKNEISRVQIMEQYIYTIIDAVKADLFTTATREELSDYFETSLPEHIEDLTLEFLELSIERAIYDQIRYLDNSGQEIVRINYNAGRPSIVAKDNLQNKSNRYYFTKTKELNEGEMYISPIDLNIEGNEIERPFKPMMRFATPVFDDEGNRQGVIVLNYLATNLLEQINRFYIEEEGTLVLYNQDGYWLKGFESEDEWGFMLENRNNRKVQNSYPDLWQENLDEKGQLENQKGLFSYVKLYPLDFGDVSSNTNGSTLAADKYSWTLLSFINKSDLTKNAKEVLKQLLIIDTVLLSMIILLAWKLATATEKRQIAEKNIRELNDLLKVINKIIRHDLLNTLTVIQWSIKEAGITDPNGLINDALTQSHAGIDLIGQMKELEGSVSTGKEMKNYQVGELMTEIANNENIGLSLQGDAQVVADQALYSTFQNIIRNAKAHGGVNTVEVTVEESNKNIIIKIADQGKGIPDEIHEKVFEENFKYGDTGNTGLGLYIVKKTIERYNGEVHIENNTPQGTIFVITLPKK